MRGRYVTRLQLTRYAGATVVAAAVTLATLVVAPVRAQSIAPASAPHRLVSRPHPRHRPVVVLTSLRLVSSTVMQEWSRVAECEEAGNWKLRGPMYSGGLGITNSNWRAYGGEQFAPNAGLATPQEQVVVARRIQPDPPDQDGCTGSW
jgi:hypothetical protein